METFEDVTEWLNSSANAVKLDTSLISSPPSNSESNPSSSVESPLSAEFLLSSHPADKQWISVSTAPQHLTVNTSKYDDFSVLFFFLLKSQSAVSRPSAGLVAIPMRETNL